MSSGDVRSPINYKIEVKRSLVDALRYAFTSHPSATMDSVKFTIEYPRTPEQYPSVIVGFREERLYDSGMGHMEDDGNIKYSRRTFEGRVTVEVFSTTSLERDYISDWLVDLLSFRWIKHENYYNKMLLHENIDIQPALGDIRPLAESTMSGVAWGQVDARIYTVGYSFPVIGTFISSGIYEDYIRRVESVFSTNVNEDGGWVGFIEDAEEKWQTPEDS